MNERSEIQREGRKKKKELKEFVNLHCLFSVAYEIEYFRYRYFLLGALSKSSLSMEFC